MIDIAPAWAAVVAAIRAEIDGDPAKRGYAGKTPGEIAALMNAPWQAVAAAGFRDVSISDVRGYLEARLVMVRLEDWVAAPGTPAGTARDAARTLLRITTGAGLTNFTTSTPGGRANILGLFAVLVASGAGGLTQQHYDDLAAMTVVPAGEPERRHPRWVDVALGLPPEARDGLPNEVTAEMIAEALA